MGDLSKRTKTWLDGLDIVLPEDPIVFHHEYLSYHDMVMLTVDEALYKMMKDKNISPKIKLAAMAQMVARNEQMHRRVDDQPQIIINKPEVRFNISSKHTVENPEDYSID